MRIGCQFIATFYLLRSIHFNGIFVSLIWKRNVIVFLLNWLEGVREAFVSMQMDIKKSMWLPMKEISPTIVNNLFLGIKIVFLYYERNNYNAWIYCNVCTAAIYALSTKGALLHQRHARITEMYAQRILIVRSLTIEKN